MLVGHRARPQRRAIDAWRRNAFGSYAGRLVKPSTSPVARIEHNGRSPRRSARRRRPPRSRPRWPSGRQQSIVSRRRWPSVGSSSSSLPDLAADAVDDDGLVAFRPHQNLVERLFDAGLPDDRAGIDALVIGLLEARRRSLRRRTEQMRGRVVRWIPSRRHFRPQHAGQFQAPGHDRRDLIVEAPPIVGISGDDVAGTVRPGSVTV